MENNNILSIINLHKIEKQLLDINEQRGNLPSKILEFNNSIEKHINHNVEYENRAVEIDKRKVILNADLEDIKKKISRLNEQMYKVKSNKEYEALLNEIDHLNRGDSQNQDELSTLNQEIESNNNNINENNENIDSLNKKLSMSKLHLENTNSTILDEETRLQIDKDNILKDISDNSILEIYATKKNEYGGLAFAAIEQSCCENCFSSLPPQLIIDAKEQSQLILCPSCNILLYLEGNNTKDE